MATTTPVRASSVLMADVMAFLGEGGALGRELPEFQRREAQETMARAVTETVESGGCLVVEAGTGIGKTYAYLVPALLSGARVLVSTSTKALQEQLVHRDLPRLVEILNRHQSLHRRVALLKGRANYLCLHRLEQAWAHRADATDAGANTAALDDVRRWAQSTRSGDLAELPSPSLDAHTKAQVTSTRENCLAGRCPRFGDCHVYRARRQAAVADVAVVNHALFMADQAGVGEGESDLLAHARVIVFDEAHSLNAVGQQAFGQACSARQLQGLAQDLHDVGGHLVGGLRDWAALRDEVMGASRRLMGACAHLPLGARIAWRGEAPDGIEPSAWQSVVQTMVSTLRHVLAALDDVAEQSPDIARLHQRAVSLLEVLSNLGRPEEGGQVRWLECSIDDVRLQQTPFRAGPSLQALWATAMPSVPQAGAQPDASAWDEPVSAEEAHSATVGGELPRSFIFTSATLGTNDALDCFTGPLGLEGARTLRLGSPFDYAAQASLYIPAFLPSANDPQHAGALADWLAEPVLRLGGRTLVLTTSLRAMHIIAERLARSLAPAIEDGRIELLVQGQNTHSWIAERFQHRGNGCVLVASQSYWQGFDVPGDALQMVVIDKLPFPVPTDPLVEAYSEYLQEQGRNPFKEHALQEAALALRQGAGRLIRSERDSGLLVVADARLAKGYGKWLQRQLPPMRVLASEAECQEQVDRLTRTSTTDHPSCGSRT
ncbi:ATP-dependent DNA helicase [Diaphorobacter ruginosibacter]|nr:ATP-dependent DNA helicase [Diaphorobacter ruginosibacter]